MTELYEAGDINQVSGGAGGAAGAAADDEYDDEYGDEVDDEVDEVDDEVDDEYEGDEDDGDEGGGAGVAGVAGEAGEGNQVGEGNERTEADGGTPLSVLTYLAKALSNDPEAVVIETEERRNGVRLNLHVAPEDMGRVIGRRGRTAQAIRTLVNVAGAKDGIQSSVDIVDD